jgi:hypothetical protein
MKEPAARFVILIPHRDPGGIIDAYRKKLFAAGYSGAYSFPVAAPLASVCRPFTRDELKELARNIRSLIQEKGGKFLSSGTGLVHCPSISNITVNKGKKDEIQRIYSFLGVLLGFPLKESLFPRTARDKILQIISVPVLCAAALGPAPDLVYMDAPDLSFRAASLANLAIRPLGSGEQDYSFEWKIGPQVWLPKAK